MFPQYVEYYHAQQKYIECRYAKCRGAKNFCIPLFLFNFLHLSFLSVLLQGYLHFASLVRAKSYSKVYFNMSNILCLQRYRLVTHDVNKK
jgi:hypothetical protein